MAFQRDTDQPSPSSIQARLTHNPSVLSRMGSRHPAFKDGREKGREKQYIQKEREGSDGWGWCDGWG